MNRKNFGWLVAGAMVLMGAGYGSIVLIGPTGNPIGSVVCTAGCSQTNDVLTVNAGGGGYATIQDETTPLTQRTTVNFTGTGVSCVDDGGASRTNCIINAGAATAGGSDRQIQYNNASALGGMASFVADASGNYARLPTSAEPAAPTTGLTLFSENRAAMPVFAWRGPLGTDDYAQGATWNKARYFTVPNSASAGKLDEGWTTTLVGTAAATTYATTNLSTSIRRLVYSTGATASTPAEMRVSTNLSLWRGNAAGLGGFFCHFRWTNPTHNANSDKMLVGLTSVTTAIAGTVVPSASINVLYAGWDAAATGISLCGNDGTGTAGCTACNTTDFPVNSTTAVFALSIYTAPNGTSVEYELKRLDTVVTACTRSNSTAADLPANTVFLGARIWMSNGATAANAAVSHIVMYCESDI